MFSLIYFKHFFTVSPITDYSHCIQRKNYYSIVLNMAPTIRTSKIKYNVKIHHKSYVHQHHTKYTRIITYTSLNLRIILCFNYFIKLTYRQHRRIRKTNEKNQNQLESEVSFTVKFYITTSTTVRTYRAVI